MVFSRAAKGASGKKTTRLDAPDHIGLSSPLRAARVMVKRSNHGQLPSFSYESDSRYRFQSLHDSFSHMNKASRHYFWHCFCGDPKWGTWAKSGNVWEGLASTYPQTFTKTLCGDRADTLQSPAPILLKKPLYIFNAFQKKTCVTRKTNKKLVAYYFNGFGKPSVHTLPFRRGLPSVSGRLKTA